MAQIGYQRMEELFDENCGKIDISQECQQLYDDFEKLTDDTLNKVFKRTTKKQHKDSFTNKIHRTYKTFSKSLTAFAKKGKIQRKVATQYRERILKINSDKIAATNLKQARTIMDLRE